MNGLAFADEFNDDSLYASQRGSGRYEHDLSFDDGTTTPELLQLNEYCASATTPRDGSEEAKLEADESWEPVREWMRTHDAEQIGIAARQRGESSMTALHFACRNRPPLDIINVFISTSVETLQWPDSFGWLPIHYACACSAAPEVIRVLAETFPDSKTTVDRRGLTPLHFALANSNTSADVVAILSLGATYVDDNGMTPLHYACAHGIPQESLTVLTEAHRPAIYLRDRHNRTPLQFALSNAGRPASSGTVWHLLDLDPNLANSSDSENGILPLRVLADYAKTLHNINNTEARSNTTQCMQILLNANPEPTADYFTALQSLPGWLSEQAVVIAPVQVLLNEKLSQRFPSAVFIFDFYILVMIIVSYSWNVVESIHKRNSDEEKDNLSFAVLSPLYFGAWYFFMREIIQMISLVSLNSFRIWLHDPSKWVNVAFIVLVLFWTVMMQTGGAKEDVFRIGTALTVVILWVKVLAFLRKMLIGFAVFVGGVFNVFRRLVAFLIVLTITLIGFAQMFVTTFTGTSVCPIESSDDENQGPFCNREKRSPYCNIWDSFLNVYTMLLGEVNEAEFHGKRFATGLFIVFMFLVVILLANVLIAIVTDSYRVIQNKRAAIVFWTNRLNFVAEMDAIANGPWKKRLQKTFGMKRGRNHHGNVDVSSGREFWKRLLDLYEDDNVYTFTSVEFLTHSFLRLFTAVCIIPSWVFLGIITAGWLWPPQLREALFTSKVTKFASKSEGDDDDRRVLVGILKGEVTELEDKLVNELRVNRGQVVQVKTSMTLKRAEIANEMRHIKRMMTVLFEQQSSQGADAY